jgi:hypothetical protein
MEESTTPIPKTDKIVVPFSPENVFRLNNYQHSGWHPFTCGNDRASQAHKAYQIEYGGDLGELIATTAGWICPVCKYTQDWAHASMLMMGQRRRKGCGIQPLTVQYCVYRKPTDYPDKYVVRKWEIYSGLQSPVPGGLQIANDLLTARKLVPEGLARLARLPNDDPNIVEVWI